MLLSLLDLVLFGTVHKKCVGFNQTDFFHLKNATIHPSYFSSHKRHRLRCWRPCFRYHYHHHHPGMSHHDFDGNADACYAICGSRINEIDVMLTVDERYIHDSFFLFSFVLFRHCPCRCCQHAYRCPFICFGRNILFSSL